MSSADALTKGLGFLHVREFTTVRWGPQGWDAVLGELRPAERAELASVLLIGWYPLALYARLLHALDEVHGTGDGALLVQCGRWQAEKDVTTLYRIVFRLMNPGTVIVKTTDYWHKFHDTGTWRMGRTGEKSLEGTLEGWGVVDAALCRELVGYLGRVLELVGAKSPNVEHPECRARGQSRCHFTARWGAVAPNAVGSHR